jgi:putative membrane protein
MERFIFRLVVNGFALFAAVYLVPGLNLQNESPVSYIVLALIFGVVNALVKPILKLLTCPIILLTLGLFTIIINVAVVYITAWLGGQFGFGLSVPDFWTGLFGALVISVVSFVLSIIFKDELDDQPRRRRS